MYKVNVTVMTYIAGHEPDVRQHSGIVAADAPDEALNRAREFFERTNPDSVVKIVDSNVEVAVEQTPGFLMDFFLPAPEDDASDVKYVGYLEFYVRMIFENGDDAYVAYTSDFSKPDAVKLTMDRMPKIYANFYEQNKGVKTVRYEYVTREQYEKHQSGVMLGVSWNDGKIDRVGAETERKD